jgi:heme exporter protein D
MNDPKEGIMTNRQKQIGTIIGMGILWGFWLLPTAEDLPDAQPATPLEWKLFIALNFVAIVYLHILNVREHQQQLREEAQQRYWERMETRSRNNHPTAK